MSSLASRIDASACLRPGGSSAAGCPKGFTPGRPARLLAAGIPGWPCAVHPGSGSLHLLQLLQLLLPPPVPCPLDDLTGSGQARPRRPAAPLGSRKSRVGQVTVRLVERHPP